MSRCDAPPPRAWHAHRRAGRTRFPTGGAGLRPHRGPQRVRQSYRDRRPPRSLTRLGMLAIRVLLRNGGWPAPLDRSKDFICWLRRLNSPGTRGPPVCLLNAIATTRAGTRATTAAISSSNNPIGHLPRYRGTAFIKDRINLNALKLLENFSRLACHCDALVFLFYRGPVTQLPECRRNTLLSVSPSQLGDRPAVTHC